MHPGDGIGSKNSNLLHFLLLSSILLTSGQGCSEQKPPEKKPAPISPEPTAQPRRTLNKVEQKAEMGKMLKVLEEMQRRVAGKVPMEGPAMMMAGTVAVLPTRMFPAGYRALLETLKERLMVLRSSSRYKTDYNKLVDTCVACHKIYAPHETITVSRMKVP